MGMFSSIKAAGSRVLSRLAGSGSGYYEVIPGLGSCNGGPRYSPALAMRTFYHWSYAAMMMNANAVAGVPLRLYARKRPGSKAYYGYRKVDQGHLKNHILGRSGTEGGPSRNILRKVAEFGEELVEVTERHPSLEVLDRVNEFQNGYELTVLQMLDLQITGNSYLYPIITGLGVPTEAVRLPPHLMNVKPGGRFIEKYVFTGAKDLDFSPEELLHFKMPNPADVFEGVGWVRAAWDAITLHTAKRQMDIAVFYNMARPDYLLTIKSGATKEAKDDFRDQLNSDHKGPKKAGKFLTASGDIGVHQLNWKFEEIGTPTRVIEEISAVSGVPVAMLLSNDPTKASSTSARLGWYRNTIRPYCRLHEEKLNEKWLPLFDGAEDMFLCYDAVSFEDLEAQSKRVAALVAAGVIEVNEARVELGYPRKEGYDKIYPPSGSTGEAAALTGDMAVGQNTDGPDTNKRLLSRLNGS